MPLYAAMKEVGLEELQTCALCRHNTASQYIFTRLILEPCLVVYRWTEARVSMRWWEQFGLDLSQVGLETEMEEEERGKR